MFELIAKVLSGLYGLPVVGGSYGLAIMMLTIAVMILLMPLTLKATRSTIKMQQVQPELKRIQKKHKGDRDALNAEMMALYQEHGINPVGGCLPMFAQMPVFIVLFRILRGLTRRAHEVPFYETGALAASRTGAVVQPADTFDPRYLSTESDLYQSLTADNEMTFGPFDLAGEALDILQDSFVSAIPYIILILFVVATSFYQQRQVTARRGSEASSAIPDQQQMILKVLPLMTGIWSFVFPAGLVLYWATSNVFRIGQQAYITHQIYGKEGATEIIAEARVKTKAVEESPKDQSGKTKSGNKSGNTSDSKVKAKKASKSGVSEKEAAWQKRKEQKAKAKPPTSSRVTPKGTAPTSNKKNRKR